DPTGGGYCSCIRGRQNPSGCALRRDRPTHGANLTRILTLALGEGLPTVFSTRDFVRAGGFMSYGPSYSDMFRRSADYVDKILRGTKPGDIPVEQPTLIELSINMQTARALSVTIPDTLLALADRVID